MHPKITQKFSFVVKIQRIDILYPKHGTTLFPFSKTLAAKFDESNPTLEIVNIQNSKANSLQITVGIEVEKTIFAMGYGIGRGGKEGRGGSGLRASRLSVGARTMDPPWPHHVLT